MATGTTGVPDRTSSANHRESKRPDSKLSIFFDAPYLRWIPWLEANGNDLGDDRDVSDRDTVEQKWFLLVISPS